ncbi:MAG: hypothetical protein KBD14_01350 [Candidatus Pacebacteria bacterium]|nr:hypothetical protein [Candidatus Paceibacterota bacterium]
MALLQTDVLDFTSITGDNSLIIKIKNVQKELNREHPQFLLLKTAYLWITKEEINLIKEKMENQSNSKLKQLIQLIVFQHKIFNAECKKEDGNYIITKEDLKYSRYS